MLVSAGTKVDDEAFVSALRAAFLCCSQRIHAELLAARREIFQRFILFLVIPVRLMDVGVVRAHLLVDQPEPAALELRKEVPPNPARAVAYKAVEAHSPAFRGMK